MKDVEIFDLLKDYKLQPDGINIAENKGNGKSMGYGSGSDDDDDGTTRLLLFQFLDMLV